jgi:hypothetical protein
MSKFSDRFKLENGILGFVMVNGVETSKADILGDNPMEDRIYTKKVKIDKDFDSIEIAYVSVSSEKPLKDDVPLDNVRINTKNREGKWCNIFLKEAPMELLEFVWETISSKN